MYGTIFSFIFRTHLIHNSKTDLVGINRKESPYRFHPSYQFSFICCSRFDRTYATADLLVQILSVFLLYLMLLPIYIFVVVFFFSFGIVID